MGDGKSRYVFLDYLRVIAISMIIFDHLGMLRNPEWYIGKVIENIICAPLHIISYFGAFGVVLFFLISGFLFANSVEKNTESKVKFLWNRFIRIYLPLLVSFITFYVFQLIADGIAPNAGYWRQFSIVQWINSATLLGYFNHVGDVINGTTWYLIPTLLFYILGTFVVTKRENKSKSIIYLFLAMLLGYGIDYVVKIPVLSTVISNSWWFMFLIMGMLIYYTYWHLIDIKSMVVLSAVNYLLGLYGIHAYSRNYYSDEPYLVSAFYAVTLFGAALIWGEHFRENRFINRFSKLSFYIYLIHMTYGSLMLSVLEYRLVYTIAFLLVVVLIILIAWGHEAVCRVVLKKL